MVYSANRLFPFLETAIAATRCSPFLQNKWASECLQPHRIAEAHVLYRTYCSFAVTPDYVIEEEPATKAATKIVVDARGELHWPYAYDASCKIVFGTSRVLSIEPSMVADEGLTKFLKKLDADLVFFPTDREDSLRAIIYGFCAVAKMDLLRREGRWAARHRSIDMAAESRSDDPWLRQALKEDVDEISPHCDAVDKSIVELLLMGSGTKEVADTLGLDKQHVYYRLRCLRQRILDTRR